MKAPISTTVPHGGGGAEGAAPDHCSSEAVGARGAPWLARRRMPAHLCGLSSGEDLPRFRFAFEVTPPMVQ